MSSLTVRKLDVDLSGGFGRRWLGGDAYRTQFFNALSMTFPIGEQMFIDSLRALPQERLDPALRAEVKDFIGQEATHRHMHVQYNAELERQGLRFAIEGRIVRRVRRIAALGVRDRVAITCALEHYTAMLADGVLRHPEWLEGAEPALRRLWEWHAVEELEHKAVAFDAYRAAGGGHLRRVLWFLHASLVFWFDIFLQTAHNLRRDGALWRPGTWTSAARMWFGRRGLAWHMAGPVLQYCSPRFHPWRHDNRGLVRMWLDRNSAAWEALRSSPPA
ncbi:metal-dependent hydrolase [Massilia sp. MS-15]|uniref:metal-dependent hydrolase n=1 Tax=Massilia sp. MS-15 TaxID=2878200 RepID=UPI001CD559A5|nr:metal-dependent hydrolase [Massilia sp. MS-15]MCA1246960.1 metal-dependent hydrolase [Massilia sp. MS-15]